MVEEEGEEEEGGLDPVPAPSTPVRARGRGGGCRATPAKTVELLMSEGSPTRRGGTTGDVSRADPGPWEG